MPEPFLMPVTAGGESLSYDRVILVSTGNLIYLREFNVKSCATSPNPGS